MPLIRQGLPLSHDAERMVYGLAKLLRADADAELREPCVTCASSPRRKRLELEDAADALHRDEAKDVSEADALAGGCDGMSGVTGLALAAGRNLCLHSPGLE